MEKIKMTTPIVEMDGDEMTGSSGSISRMNFCFRLWIYIQNIMIWVWFTEMRQTTR